MNKMKTINMNELLRRLVESGLSPETAYTMMLIQDWYLYKLGIQDELHFPDEEVALFDNEVGTNLNNSSEVTYDPKQLESYFIYKLRVSENEAQLFTKIEFSYLEELGIA